ncbi:MAG TPA: hypothetical protein VNZ53_29835 [Steroidobacteraceae bacterium]|jgi:hypothetical protein|nr:hypothetical protein [Steroidobacteraceae bacterium]
MKSTLKFIAVVLPVLMYASAPRATSFSIVENGDGNPAVTFAGFTTNPTCMPSAEAVGCSGGTFADSGASGGTLIYVFDLGETETVLSDRLRLVC